MTERVPMHFEVAYPGDKWYEVYAHPTETGLSAYIVDKTEHKKAQEALRQKAKLESIGLLAGGVAHDFNNLLVGILGAASLAEEMVDQDRPERELLRLISDSAERAASLTRQMLTYAGKSKTDRLPVDLNRIVIDTVQLLRSTIPPAIQITLDLTPGAPMLTGDPGQVQQIVLNLLTNAIEAIPQGSAGAVRVKTALWKNAGAGPADMENLAPGDYVELQVTDSGLGMTRDVMDRIFDPFFTTKFAGRGLGLAAVQGIVRSHQGSIDVQSEPGHGTTFRVLLRASEGIHEPAPPETRVAPRGNGTVLVIDDESVVRATSERMLSHGGYNVLVAATGAEGIETFREKRHELTAVIIDVSMPDRTGFDVLRELRAELDGVRVFLSSGHGQQDLESELANFPAARFLKKPYRAEELLKALALGA
jgi:nitrogen-specific signal transduction histidine kinase